MRPASPTTATTATTAATAHRLLIGLARQQTNPQSSHDPGKVNTSCSCEDYQVQPFLSFESQLKDRLVRIIGALQSSSILARHYLFRQAMDYS